MSNHIKGVISKVYDNGPKEGRYGTQYSIKVLVDGEGYSGFFSKPADKLGLEEGRLVEFDVRQNGQYQNIDTKSLKVSESAPAPSRAQSGSAGASASRARNGAQVGMAVNNAVLLIANKLVEAPEGGVLITIEKVARAILGLVDKLEAVPVGKPAPKAKPAPSPAPSEEVEEVEEDEEAPPPPKPKAKPKAAPKAKAKPAPEPQPDQVEVEDDFEDDLPF